MNVHIITIGDEILIGQIIDTNSAWMAQQLNLVGAQVVGITTVSDTHDAIIEGLTNASKGADVILMTGGLGPTKDDITKKTLAEYFNTDFIFHQETWDRIERLFAKWGRKTTEAHREQCFMPGNATILKNKMGTAPGMWFDENGKIYVSMPGVPYEMKYLMEYEVIPNLRLKFPGKPIAHRTILTVGEGESRLAKRIEPFENSLPKNLKLAYLPGLGQVRLRISGTDDDESNLLKQLDEKAEELKAMIPEFIFGFERDTLQAAVGRILKEKNLTLATAESCTGGYLAHKITSIPGSSAYFMGSIIAYSNEVKVAQLGVQKSTLEAHGAVSKETVTEMVTGALKSLKTDIAVATSGIAGPDGGTEEKPVGTIWMAVGNNEKIITQKINVGKDRVKNIEFSSVQALNLVRKFVLKNY